MSWGCVIKRMTYILNALCNGEEKILPDPKPQTPNPRPDLSLYDIQNHKTIKNHSKNNRSQPVKN